MSRNDTAGGGQADDGKGDAARGAGRASGPDSGWDAGWDGHERAQLRRLARLSLIDKIAWLEEAQKVALRLTRKPAAGRDSGPTP